jgi:phage terminase small subunit
MAKKAEKKIKEKPEGGPLSVQQKLFADEYLKDRNGTRAAIAAGYSENGATQIGSRLLTYVNIQEYLNKKVATIAERANVQAVDVLKEIKKLATSDIRKIFDEDGNLLPVHLLPDDVAASIASIEVVTSRIPGTEPVEVEHTHKIKFWDKRGSLELLGKHLKMFTEKVEMSGPEGGPIKLTDTDSAAKIAAIMALAQKRKEEQS